MILPAQIESAIVAHARESSPEECCGLLLGTRDAIAAATPVRNTADDPRRRYRIDPHDYFEAIRHARGQSLSVIGAYHSHPGSSATPSVTDRAEGFADFLFLIVGLGVEPPELMAWTWAHGNFTALPIVRFP